MKKVLIVAHVFLVLSCSNDSDNIKKEVEEELENKSPLIANTTFTINEHAAPGTVIGTVAATDADNDPLTYSVNNESGLQINEQTGELSLGNALLLDFEAAQQINFTATVFDGLATVEKEFVLALDDIDEYTLLTEAQKETLAYFEYLTLWQAPTNSALTHSSRWVQPMKLFLDGQITSEFRTTVEAVLEEYNVIFENSDFNISLVETLEESNAHLYFGQTGDLESLWADMFAIVDGKTYSGYAITQNNSDVLSDTRMWISNPISVLFKHEMGHALGFGHSEKCEGEKSFMCSTIAPEHDFLEEEKKIIRWAYGNDMPAGLDADQIKTHLANKMVLED